MFVCVCVYVCMCACVRACMYCAVQVHDVFVCRVDEFTSCMFHFSEFKCLQKKLEELNEECHKAISGWTKMEAKVSILAELCIQ